MIFFYFFIFLNIIFSNSFYERYFVPNLYPISHFQHFSDVNSDTINHNFVFPKNTKKINQSILKKYFYNWYDFNSINSSFKLISEIIIKENLRKITNGSILIRLSKILLSKMILKLIVMDSMIQTLLVNYQKVLEVGRHILITHPFHIMDLGVIFF